MKFFGLLIFISSALYCMEGSETTTTQSVNNDRSIMDNIVTTPSILSYQCRETPNFTILPHSSYDDAICIDKLDSGPLSRKDFKYRLRFSLAEWKKNDKKHVCLCLPFALSELLTVAIDEGFKEKPNALQVKTFYLYHDLTSYIVKKASPKLMQYMPYRCESDRTILPGPDNDDDNPKEFAAKIKNTMRLIKDEGKNMVVLDIPSNKSEYLAACVKHFFSCFKDGNSWRLTAFLQPSS